MSDQEPQTPAAEPPPEPPINTLPVATEPQSSYLAQMGRGFVAFWLLLLGIGGIVGLVAMAALLGHPPPGIGGFVALAILLVGLGAVGVFLLNSRRKYGPGMVPGLLIGLGLLGLSAGICFVAAR